MGLAQVFIPQIGEGLQEARLVAFLKSPGDRVERDEPIYQMETDKAVMDIESPYAGVLKEWLAGVDDILKIGDAVAVIEVEGEVVAEAPPSHAPAPAEAAPAASRAANIPPRTRAYAKEKGISDEVLVDLAAKTDKLMPTDIDAYLGGGAPAGAGYKEVPLSSKQRLLASRLVRSSSQAVQGTITVVVDWSGIEAEREKVKQSASDFKPSTFTMFAYAVAKTMAEHPMFRSTWVGEATLRTYDHVSLGIAVSLPGDELVLAVVEEADALSWRDFAARTREKIDLARSGQDQANESVTLSLTNMQSFRLRDAVPVVVPPAVATLFIGEVYTTLDPKSAELKPMRAVNLVMSFDHRLINGVGAAEFLAAVGKNVEAIAGILV